MSETDPLLEANYYLGALEAQGKEHAQLNAEITRLKSVIQSLVEAVTPFAELARKFDFAEGTHAGNVGGNVTYGDLRRALEAKVKAEEALKGEML